MTINLYFIGFVLARGYARDGVPSRSGFYWDIFLPRTGEIILSNY